MQLQNYEEINGILDGIEFHKKEGIISLIFSFKKKIDLPINACDKNLIVSNLGKKIAIIRIDNDFKIRNIKNKNK